MRVWGFLLSLFHTACPSIYDVDRRASLFQFSINLYRFFLPYIFAAVRFGRVPKREKARILAAMQQSTQNRGHQRAMATELDDQPRLLAAVLRAHMDTCEFTRDKVTSMRQRARDCPSYSMPTMVSIFFFFCFFSKLFSSPNSVLSCETKWNSVFVRFAVEVPKSYPPQKQCSREKNNNKRNCLRKPERIISKQRAEKEYKMWIDKNERDSCACSLNSRHAIMLTLTNWRSMSNAHMYSWRRVAMYRSSLLLRSSVCRSGMASKI